MGQFLVREGQAVAGRRVALAFQMSWRSGARAPGAAMDATSTGRGKGVTSAVGLSKISSTT